MKNISKTYEAGKYEDEIYKLWENSGFFSPDKIKSKKKYCNVLPPPNANGELHVGNASGYVFMDIFGRYHRMKGEKTLLLPGKDHAGILTQVVYERKIKEERNITRHDLGREKFYKEAYDFCIDRASYMRAQEKKIGISADWSREKFTLDPDVLQIALETFVNMHKDGMVYRGERIINWCPRCATALSDLEVIHKETDGKLYYVRYPIKDSKKFITVATTRPETMLGDVAVAVNPGDLKYKDLIGKTAVLPLVGREIPIIADKRIDREFGTGAVKITPSHDALDWEIGNDHKLETIQVINEEAKITKLGGKYEGQGVLEARGNILEDLEKLGLLEKTEETKINVLICERCKNTIQPLISKQWFISVDAKKYSLKYESLKAVKNNKIKVYPENFRKTLIQWFSNLRDWCVSRQIWWGPRIPVWYCKNCGEDKYIVSIKKPDKCPLCKDPKLYQDPDTFDTWFTSGQWAYSTLGYPEGKNFKEFYPTDMMVMGRDILFFWSARMIMMSLYRTGKIPFKNLYFTGLIRDKEGRKMSKSRGNGINPLEMIDKYGADALRLSVFSGVTPGQDSRIYEEKIESFRNFVTKLWNIYRYCISSSENFELVGSIYEKEIKTLADKWIINELNKIILVVTSFLENKDISLAQEALRKFTWDQFADWYLEIHKIEKNEKVLGYVLDKILKLWHPFTPFVTEKIFQDLAEGKKLLMVEKWPVADGKMIDKKAEKDFKNLQNITTKIRNLRASYGISPSVIINAYSEKIENNREIIEKLARVKIILEKPEVKMIKISNLNLDIASLIDVKKETERMEKEIKNLESAILKTENLLKNEKFIKSAPEKIIEDNKNRVLEYKEKISLRQNLLEDLNQL
ncbi:MAG TPA: valine--tRNA ligase [Candidatus Moranbacteria bacterium]|nr:valine--tRNA ligase [Candidatus Moranbacteria bacterium]